MDPSFGREMEKAWWTFMVTGATFFLVVGAGLGALLVWCIK